MVLTIDKKRSIGLASKEVGVQEHVIRFWETQFPNYRKPMIVAGGRRYFIDKDIKTLLFIKDYLYTKGYTIKGLQNLLKNENLEFNNVAISTKNNEDSIDTKSSSNYDNIKKVNNINRAKMLNFKEDLLNFYNKLKNI